MGCCMSSIDAHEAQPFTGGQGPKGQGPQRQQEAKGQEDKVYMPKTIRAIRLTELHALHQEGALLAKYMKCHIYTRNFRLTPNHTIDTSYPYNVIIHDNSRLSDVLEWKNFTQEHIVGLDWEHPVSKELLKMVASRRPTSPASL